MAVRGRYATVCPLRSISFLKILDPPLHQVPYQHNKQYWAILDIFRPIKKCKFVDALRLILCIMTNLGTVFFGGKTGL